MSQHYFISFSVADGVKVSTKKFTIDKEVESQYLDGKGVLHTLCTTPQENVLQCDHKEPNFGLTLKNVFNTTSKDLALASGLSYLKTSHIYIYMKKG